MSKDTRTAAEKTVGDPLDAIQADAENFLATKLAAGGPLLALEAATTVAAFHQIAVSLRLAVTQQPPSDSLTDDPTGFTADFLRAQLGKEAALSLANAETRANAALHAARSLWRAWLDNEGRKQRWSHVGQQGQRGTR